MEKFEELLKKRDAEIELERNKRVAELARKSANNTNLILSFGTGIIGGIIGLFAGAIGGGILGFLLGIIYIIFENKGPKAWDNVMETTAQIAMILCTIIGFFIGFIINREKQ